jgi:hypothetical protein
MINAMSYPTGCYAGSPITVTQKPPLENSTFSNKIDTEVAIHQADAKVQFLQNTLVKCTDMTASEKQVVQDKLLDAQRELATLRNNYRLFN